MSKQSIAVISMGQLMSTTLDASITAFAEASNHSEAYIKAKLAYDQLPFGKSYIDEFKKGEISEKEFYDGIRSRLDHTPETLSDDQIRQAWNAMTGISQEHEERVRELAHTVIEQEILLVVASATNQLHHNANLAALERVLGENFAPFMEQTTFALSHHQETLNRNTLAANGIEDTLEHYDLSLRDVQIASFHRDIQADAVKKTIIISDAVGEYSRKEMESQLQIEQIPTQGNNLAAQLSHFAQSAEQGFYTTR